MSDIFEFDDFQSIDPMGPNSPVRVSRAVKRSRSRSFFSDPAHTPIWRVGRILAKRNKSGVSLAETLIANGFVTFGAFKTLNGQTVKPRDGESFRISFSNLKVWGCPFCESAHGTAVGCSSNGDNSVPKLAALLSNTFYYAPLTCELFVISDTCYKNYVRDLGMEPCITSPSPIRDTFASPSPASPSKAYSLDDIIAENE